MRQSWVVLLLAAAACSSPAVRPLPSTLSHRELPTGVVLDPAGGSIDVGPYPFSMIRAPEADRVILLNSGYGAMGIQVVQVSTGQVLQTIKQGAAFVGATFDREGTHLYVSGGNRDLVYVYNWQGGAAALADSIVLEPRAARQAGIRYPAGMALAPDGSRLYVAENLSDSLAVIDVATHRVVQRVPAGRYPYGVVVTSAGDVYSSAWGSYEVRRWRAVNGSIAPVATIHVGRHPSSLLLNGDQSRLFVASASTDRVAAIDTRSSQVVGEIVDTIPGASGEGSTPVAMLLSARGDSLWIAEADNNAVAVSALSAATSGVVGAHGNDQVAGRVPVGWYPTALAWHGDSLIVANAKGHGTRPNAADGPGPGAGPNRKSAESGYTLGQLRGTLSVIAMHSINLPATTRRVAHANGWDVAQVRGDYPAFAHVIYIIKENRTYDQVFGDLSQADGDTSLVFFNRSVSPNHHALADRFGVFDRFFVNAEVSADGHNWSTGAYTTDYVQKTVPLNYGSGGRTYDFEGENRDKVPAAGEDAAEPANGYIWDLAQRRGVTFMNFGEFVADPDRAALSKAYLGVKPFLRAHTDSAYAGFDLDITDQSRADEWLKVFAGWVQRGDMPALQTIHLPNDHTKGASAGSFTPRAYMADNDLALGRMIEALSHSPYWKNSIVFVLEDDAQNGPDHVDSHRSPLLIISAYNRPHVWHRFGNTTDVIATIEGILGLNHLSQFDAFGRPFRGIFAAQPDLAPYTVLQPSISLTERNPRNTPAAKASARLDFRLEDLADDDDFNRVLWLAIKGSAPYPVPRSMTGPEQ